MERKTWLLLSMFLCLAGLTAQAGTSFTDSVLISGHMRHYRMVLPSQAKPGIPLVVLLHGYGGGGFDAPQTCMDSIARTRGFALCVPEGLRDPKGQRSWNVGYPFQEGWQVDDVDDLCQLARYVQKTYRLSATDAFLTGMSNGGEMCYLMAYRNQTTFKAIASVAGLTLQWMYKELDARRPVPFMEIHGTEDRVSEWTGDLANQGGWGAYLPVPIAIGRMVALNRCTHEEVRPVPVASPHNGHQLFLHHYEGGDAGCDVWLYRVVGGTHCWHTDDMNTGDVIWRFFSQFVEK